MIGFGCSSFKGELGVPLKGLQGSFWVDIRQVKGWCKSRGLEVPCTYNWGSTSIYKPILT